MSTKTTLIGISSLAITVLMIFPQVLIWQVDRSGALFRFSPAGFLLRTASIFFTAAFFFSLYLKTGTIRIGLITINFDIWWQRILLSVVLFVMLDFSLLHLHLLLFEPLANRRLLRFLFNIRMVITLLMTMLLSQIYRLVLYNYQIRLSNAALLKTNAETRYEVLKNQINPHFLFNSLNTINSLIETNSQAAMQFVNHMSDVFRYVLKSSDADMIMLNEELKFIEAYTHLLKERHGNKLQVSVNVQPGYMQYRLPPMALQILVENAVKHNVVSQTRPLHICIFINSEGGITVQNNLQKRIVAEPSTGLGLHNLNQRCKYLSNHELIIQKTQNSFLVTIPLIQ